jgi:predicted Zn-dependent peptidase
MAQYALFYDNPGLINSRYERVEAITTADLQRVARQYLVKTNRTIVVTVPRAEVETPGRGGAQ